MTDEFGWSRALYTLPMSIGSFMGGLASLIVGPLMDRYGSRIIMTVAIALMGLTFVLMGAVQELWHHFALQILGRTVIASTFLHGHRRSSSPSGSSSCVAGRRAGFEPRPALGQIAFPSWERILVSGSWRTAWVAMGITVWASSLLPALLFLRRQPEDHGLLPDGVDIRDAGRQGRRAAPVEVAFDRRMALRSAAFYLIAAAVSIQSFVTTSIHFHWYSYLTDVGVSSEAAVISLSLSPLISMPVSIAAGLAAERVPVQRLMAVSYYFMAVSIVLFLFTDNALLSYAFGLLFGTATGILFTVMNIIWADYFGRASIGGIRGMVSPVHMFSNSMGPLAAAWSHDLTGSYLLVFTLSAVLSAVGGTLVLLARRPRLTDG